MNNRIFPVIAVVTLMALSSGCSGMRNFLFGRGARCGLCNTLSNVTPQFGNTMQAPYGQQTYAPQSAAPSRGCGLTRLFGRGQANAAPTCGPCGEGHVMQYGDCGCGNVCGNSCGGGTYGGVVTDPYMSGQVIDGSMPYEGQIVGESTYPGSAAPIQSDDFSARKFDSDGNRILWEEPLPPGVTAQ